MDIKYILTEFTLADGVVNNISVNGDFKQSGTVAPGFKQAGDGYFYPPESLDDTNNLKDDFKNLYTLDLTNQIKFVKNALNLMLQNLEAKDITDWEGYDVSPLNVQQILSKLDALEQSVIDSDGGINIFNRRLDESQVDSWFAQIQRI